MILVLEKEGGIKLGPGRGAGSPEGEMADCAAVLAQPPSFFRSNWAGRVGPLVSGNSEAPGAAWQGGGPHVPVWGSAPAPACPLQDYLCSSPGPWCHHAQYQAPEELGRALWSVLRSPGAGLSREEVWRERTVGSFKQVKAQSEQLPLDVLSAPPAPPPWCWKSVSTL